MQLTDMAISEQEAKDKISEETKPSDVAKYPYGLRLCLNEDVLKKLGISSMEVGAKVNVAAVATVVSSSAYQEVDGDNCRSIDIQIEGLGIEQQGGKSFDELANQLYAPKK